MARRRKSEDTALGYLLIILIALVAAAAALLFGAALAAPIILFIWWIYSEAQWANQPRKNPTATLDEQGEIDSLTNLLIEHRESRASIYKIGDESGIPRRGDNLFDGRYGAGRDVNNQLERLDFEITRLNDELLKKQGQITARVTSWTNSRAKILGSRVGVAVYLSSFVAIGTASPPWAESIGKLTDVFGVKLSNTMAVWFGSSAAAAVAAGLVLLVVTSSTKQSQ